MLLLYKAQVIINTRELYRELINMEYLLKKLTQKPAMMETILFGLLILIINYGNYLEEKEVWPLTKENSFRVNIL